jgi:signal transduction histidine kinase
VTCAAERSSRFERCLQGLGAGGLSGAGRSREYIPSAVGRQGLALDADIEAGSDDALLGDPTRVRQILFNLLSNALRFTERGGVRVRVDTVPLGGGSTRATLAVADTGVGLARNNSPGYSNPSCRPTARPHGNSEELGLAFRSCAG